MSQIVFTQDEFRKMHENDLWKNLFALTASGKIAIRVTSCNAPANDFSFFVKDVVPTTEGIVGDMYLDKNKMDLYGPKAASGWGTPVSLKSENKWILEKSAEGNDGYKVIGNIDLEDKLVVSFISDIQNDGVATLDYKNTGPKNIVDIDGNTLCNRDIKKDRLIFARYDNANDRYQLVNPNIETFKTLDSTNVVYNITNASVDRDFDVNNTIANELVDILFTLVSDLNDGGLFSSTPTCSPSGVVQTWVAQNGTGLRDFDVNNTNFSELANVIASLILDLQNGNFFNGSILQKTNSQYNVSNTTILRNIDKNTVNGIDLAKVLSTIISELKQTKIII